MKVDFLTIDPHKTPCNQCKAYSFPITRENMLSYFNGYYVKCEKCGEEQNWWNLLIRHFEWGVPSYLFSMVGGFTTSFVIKMKPGERFEIDLEQVKIPVDSKILFINYTANGKGLIPIEVHGNTPFRHFIPKNFYLYGLPHGEPAEETPVAIQVCWSEKSDVETLENLVSSVEAFSRKLYNSSVIPANVAVEATLSKLLSEYLEKYSGKDNVKDFLSNGATYSHQLNVLLPLIAQHEKFPIIPDHIRGSLNKLRGLRNQLAHEAKTKIDLDNKVMSELLCSAAFGLAYLLLLGEKIIDNSISR